MKKHENRFPTALITMIAVFLALTIAAAAFLDSMRGTYRAGQTDVIARAVRRAAVACYAAEGFYPPDTDYLREHYGLRWDEDAFAVSYDIFASNVMPDVRVHRKGAAE